MSWQLPYIEKQQEIKYVLLYLQENKLQIQQLATG
jgi:hypothetical protein